jgi:transposase
VKKINKYKTKKSIVYKNQFHVIWTVKYRKELLTGKIEERLKEIIYEVCQEKEVELKAIEVMPDHVHVFIDVDPRQPLHLLIKAFKGRTSNELRKEFKILTTRIPSLWTRSYFCCTVGHISEETIQKYIEEQKNR